MLIITRNENIQNISEIDKILQENVGKDLFIRLKNHITVHGKLKNFDQHLNLILKDGNITSEEGNEKFQETLLRGSNIVMIAI